MSDTQPTTHEHQTEWSVIHAYTRAEALANGVLVDVTSVAREAGLKVPTAVTAAVFDECIEWTESDAEQSRTHQDQKGRLWDVVYLAAFKARTLVKRGVRQNQVIFQLDIVPRPGRTHPRRRTLKLVIGPGDNHEPVASRRHHHASRRRLNPAGNRTISCPPQHNEAEMCRLDVEYWPTPTAVH